jgi:hypothetical protein
MANLTVDQRWRLWALRNAEKLEAIKSSIRRRWPLPDWDIHFPWWRTPSQVRILIYAEGGDITFTSNLSHVTTLLRSRPYFYADFEITTAHRNAQGTGADFGPIHLDDPRLDLMNKFDEIWFFGFNDIPNLQDPELALLDTFIKSPKCGGVLVTGDHEDRGKSIAQQIPRAGKMRKYPSPGVTRPDWNNSLEEGPDPNCTFDPDDQSDDVPQKIIPALFPVKSLPGLPQLLRPHPVLCGPEGTIDVLPDHQHEGLALAPTVDPTDTEWPIKNGHQEPPLLIAKGVTKEPQTGSREFDVLSAYNGHTVDVGRIVADSSWHHWFDSNLDGVPGSEFYRGFDVSPEGRAALRKIETFYLNCGVWLAPPARQREMRLAAWWSILKTGAIAELSPHAPLSDLGEQAISALTRHASICAASDWIFGPDIENQLAQTDTQRLYEHCLQLNVSVEQYLAGGILRALMTKLSSSNPIAALPLHAPSDEALENVINEGIHEALNPQ